VAGWSDSELSHSSSNRNGIATVLDADAEVVRREPGASVMTRTDSAIVLCGGRSSRMGRDKATLPFGSETLLTRVVRVVAAVVDDVVVVGNVTQAMDRHVRVVADSIEGLGPLAGLTTGLAEVRHSRALVVGCDMPLLSPLLLRRLLTLAGDADACVPRVDGTPMTTCAVYSTRVLAQGQSQLATGTRSLRALLDGLSVVWVDGDDLRDVDPELLSFWDCDTPDRYHTALQHAGLPVPFGS
jgi:molybdopterin-guanine dinucleotide biosynthesis protein A